jgi:hypothetical protein
VNLQSEIRNCKRVPQRTEEAVLQVGIHVQGHAMYTGTLIDDLIATVERAETSPRLDPEQEAKLAYWYEVAQNELASLSYELAGVA